MLAYWCFSPNFGDRLTYWLVEKITGKPPAFVNADDPRPHLLGAGSILSHARRSSVVWGAGFANAEDRIQPGSHIRLCRGPVSAQRARECGCKVPSTYGDPGLLCPMFRYPKAKAHKLGVLYHYEDQSRWPEIDGARHINALADLDTVIDEITRCECLLSSSLHGIVLADAYGVSVGWLHSPRIGGDGTKFRDHFLATGGGEQKPIQWSDVEGKSIAQIVKMIPEREVKFRAESILATFPHEL